MQDILMVIDMQKDFIEDGGALTCGLPGQLIVPKIKELVEDALRVGTPVIFTGDFHEEDDREFEQFPPHCIKGEEGSELVDSLFPFLKEPNVYRVNKTRYSPFYETELDAFLKTLGGGEPLRVTVVGVCTNICVYFTVEELRNRDYETIVLKDLVATFDEKAHEVFLSHMASVLGAEVK